MFDIAFNAGAVVLILTAFGLPLVLAVAPRVWQRWWPAAAPLYGLAGLAAVQLPLGTIRSPGETAIPALVLALIALVFCWRRYGGPPRPAIASILVVLAVIPGGLLAYRPSVRLQEPRPSGVLNEDSIYYLGIDAWLQEHGVREEPPPPSVDGFFAPARAAWENHLRVGVDLVNIETSAALGVDPLETLPSLAASLVAVVGLSVALAFVALRAPPWAAVAAALLITTRPETVRLSLDSYVAQAAGVALVPVAGAALALALSVGTWRWLIASGLFASALAAYYVEYLPWLVLMGLVVVGVLIAVRQDNTATDEVAGRPLRSPAFLVARRAMLIAGISVVTNPLAVYSGVRSLGAGSDLSGESIVPFFGLLQDLSLVTGPFSVLHPTPEWSLVFGVATAVVIIVALPHLPWTTSLALGAMLLSAMAFVLHQAYVQEYSYGLYKVLGLAAPIVAMTLLIAAATRSMPIGIRVTASMIVTGLLLLNTLATLTVSRASVTAFNGMVPEDDDLVRIPALLPTVQTVALEGTDAAGTPNARQHYGVYFLRRYNNQRVVYARGKGSYFLTSLRQGRADVDETYAPDYGSVVSWGPSLTQGKPMAAFGGWHVYRRAAGPNLLLVGRTGWNFMTTAPDASPMRWTTGPAHLWLSANRPAKVRLALRVLAPFSRETLRVRVGEREVLSRKVGTTPVTVYTTSFTVPRGRTVLSFHSQLRTARGGGDPLGVGLLSASVESR